MPPGYSAQPGQQVPNYLVQSILVTLFCCLPLGIAAIVYAAQVNGKLQAGDMAGAMAASKNAKLFCWISFWIGVGGTLIWIAIVFLGALGNITGRH
ncbi:MAG TPA: CD225/dispanin family protein [Candidatus Angelobacter sp.]|nr:CD225/dispanin family protein [Candidatus Angelobacter sp.]